MHNHCLYVLWGFVLTHIEWSKHASMEDVQPSVYILYGSVWFHVASQLVLVLKTSMNIWTAISQSSCHHSADVSLILMILGSSTLRWVPPVVEFLTGELRISN